MVKEGTHHCEFHIGEGKESHGVVNIELLFDYIGDSPILYGLLRVRELSKKEPSKRYTNLPVIAELEQNLVNRFQNMIESNP